MSTRSSASTSSSRVGSGGGAPGEVLEAPVAAAEGGVAAVGEDTADDGVEFDEAAEGGDGEAIAATAPRGAFNVERMSSRMMRKVGE